MNPHCDSNEDHPNFIYSGANVYFIYNYEIDSKRSIHEFNFPNFFSLSSTSKMMNQSYNISEDGFVYDIRNAENESYFLTFDINKSVKYSVSVHGICHDKKVTQIFRIATSQLPIISQIFHNRFNFLISHQFEFLKISLISKDKWVAVKSMKGIIPAVDDDLFEISVEDSKPVIRQRSIKSISQNIMNDSIVNINSLAEDQFKYAVSLDCGIINIYNPSKSKLLYSLSSGSQTVVPKSFVFYKHYKGFHYVSLTDTSVIGANGNMLRIYSFLHNMKG